MYHCFITLNFSRLYIAKIFIIPLTVVTVAATIVYNYGKLVALC